MLPTEKLLEYGIAGFAVIVLLIVVPAVVVPAMRSWGQAMKTFTTEIAANRLEREEMRKEHNEMVCNHLGHNTEVLEQMTAAMAKVCGQMDIISKRMNGGLPR